MENALTFISEWISEIIRRHCEDIDGEGTLLRKTLTTEEKSPLNGQVFQNVGLKYVCLLPDPFIVQSVLKFALK